MDLGTIIGLVCGVSVVLFTILVGDNPLIFLNVQGLLIVFGGTIATTLIRFPLPKCLGAIEVVKNAFSVELPANHEVIEELVALARKARKEGLLALEDHESEDEFLKRGLMLLVDGADADAVENVLLTNVRYVKQRHKEGQDIFREIGDAAPAFGMIGTLIGLVLMLSNMQDVTALGPAMAVAILTTLYGALIANVVALPVAKKLEVRSREEGLIRELMVVGLSNIAKGENPRMLETVLKSFLRARDLPSEPDKPQEVKAA
jgi:chemotaxis protein MotA